jgi:hypothetical protein
MASIEYKVTKHALDRFKQRTRLSLKNVDDKSLRVLFYKFLRESHSEPRTKLYPHILNKRLLTDIRVNGVFKFFIVGKTVVTVIYNDEEDWWK